MTMESPPDPGIGPWQRQFRLRTLLALFVPCALLLSLWKVGGRLGVETTLEIGVASGALVIVVTRGRLLPILMTSVTGAVVGTIVGIYFLGMDISDFESPKLPYDIKFLVWWTFGGAITGSAVARLASGQRPRST